jgi:SAM-dependent methyltransferase
MNESTQYLLGNSPDERERLLRQGELFGEQARWLLDRIDIRPGWRALEVGCGPLGILDLLAERVGSGGAVVGLDRDRQMRDWAQLSLAERGLRNVQIVAGEAESTGLRRESFDFVHARLVLINVADCDAVVGEMAALARPGGVVAVQDLDWVSWVCEPPHPAWDKLVSATAAVRQAHGLDVNIGRHMPALLRRAGLVDVEVKAFAPVWKAGDLYQYLLIGFAELHRDKIVSAGLLGDQEMTDLGAALRAHLDHPDTLVIHPLLFQAWGRKPGL